MPVTYTVALPDPAQARGSHPDLAFSADGPDGFAEQLQQALRTDDLFERWAQMQPEPDEVDPLLGATDPQASVTGRLDSLRILLQIRTALPGEVVKHRLHLLAGAHWQLRDVRL